MHYDIYVQQNPLCDSLTGQDCLGYVLLRILLFGCPVLGPSFAPPEPLYHFLSEGEGGAIVKVEAAGCG